MTDLAVSFLNQTPWAHAARVPLAGDASSRLYERLELGDKTAILMIDPELGNLRKFEEITAVLQGWNYSAPKILHEDPDKGLLILEDLGNGLFARLIEADPQREEELYKLAVDFLIDLTKKDKPIGLPYFSQSYVLDQNAMFLDWYVPDFLTKPLEDNARFFFHQIWRQLLDSLEESQEVFLYRDFHAENLLFLPDRTGFQKLGLLDYQDAMTGPPAYDLASLLQDVRRAVSPLVAQQMIEYYVSETGVDDKNFRRNLAILGAHRCLRILGIFTKLAKEQGKTRYTAFLPRVIGHLNENLAHPDLVALKHWIKVTIGVRNQEVLL